MNVFVVAEVTNMNDVEDRLAEAVLYSKVKVVVAKGPREAATNYLSKVSLEQSPLPKGVELLVYAVERPSNVHRFWADYSPATYNIQ